MHFENYKQIKIEFHQNIDTNNDLRKYQENWWVAKGLHQNISCSLSQNYAVKVVRVVLFLDEHSVSLALGHPVVKIGHFFECVGGAAADWSI